MLETVDGIDDIIGGGAGGGGGGGTTPPPPPPTGPPAVPDGFCQIWYRVDTVLGDWILLGDDYPKSGGSAPKWTEIKADILTVVPSSIAISACDDGGDAAWPDQPATKCTLRSPQPNDNANISSFKKDDNRLYVTVTVNQA